MKRVLLLHYHFLPVHHVGVKHLLGHARHLHESGWAPTVLTREWPQLPAVEDHWGLTWEPHIEASVSGAIAIERTHEASARPRRLPRDSDPWILRKFLALRHLLVGSYPDSFVPWIAPAFEAAVALHHRTPFDAILSYCPPETNVILGSRVARHLGIPWVVYFGDLYGFHLPVTSGGSGGMVRSALHRYWMRPASACAAVSPAMVRYIEHTYGVPSSLVVVGFDECDFVTAPPSSQASRMVISHVGSLYPGLQRPQIFLDGLDLFLAAHPDAASRLVVRFVGTKCDAVLRAMLEGRPSAQVSEVLPKVDAGRAIEYVRESDLLLAFTLIEPHGRGTLSYPSKVFEAFGACRPILCMPSDGDWVDQLLQDTLGGTCASDPHAVAAALAGCYGTWLRTGHTEFGGRRDLISAFTHVAQSRRLAAVLDNAVTGGGSGPSVAL